MLIDYYQKTMFHLIVVLIVLFIYTLFTYLISHIYNVNLYYVTLLNFLSYILFAPFILDLIKNGRINILQPIYIVNGTFYLYFVFKPWMDLLLNLKYYFGMNLFSYLPLATIYVMIGIVMLELGYYSIIDVSTFVKKFSKINSQNNNSNRAIKYAIFLLLIGSIMFYLYTRMLNMSFISLITLNLFNTSPIRFASSSIQQSNPFINYLYSSQYLLVGSFAILYAFQKKWRFLLLPLFLAIFALFTTIGFRFILVVMIVFLVFYRYLKKSEIPKLKDILFLILIIFLMFLVVGGVGAIRDSIRTGNDIKINQLNLQDIWINFAYNLNIYQTVYAMVVNIPKYHNYIYGYTYYLAIVQPIPRGLWPNKPAGIPDVESAIFAGNPRPFESGQAYPIIGDFYINFGLIGIIILMFLFGLSLKILWKYLEIYKNNNWVKIIFSLSSGYLIQLVSRGWPPQILTELFFLIFPIIFGQWLTNRFSFRTK